MWDIIKSSWRVYSELCQTSTMERFVSSLTFKRVLNTPLAFRFWFFLVFPNVPLILFLWVDTIFDLLCIYCGLKLDNFYIFTCWVLNPFWLKLKKKADNSKIFSSHSKWYLGPRHMLIFWSQRSVSKATLMLMLFRTRRILH